jgi:hypothetical protein
MKAANFFYQCQSPVLILAFNRVNSVKRVLEAVRKVRPKRLFLACDGPRPHKGTAEAETVRMVRKTLVEAADWECELQTLFNDKNLGCCAAVSSAVSWFFEQVEQGIILEDDCCPSDSFFRFCDYGLAAFKGNPEIASLSGSRFQCYGISSGQKLDLSSVFFCWGWASWRRAWQHYDPDVFESPITKKDIPNRLQRHFFKLVRRKIQSGQSDSWAYRFFLSAAKHRMRHVLAPENYILNFDSLEGTTNMGGRRHWIWPNQLRDDYRDGGYNRGLRVVCLRDRIYYYDSGAGLAGLFVRAYRKLLR